MTIKHDWIVPLCEYHAIKFSASHFAFDTIKEALRQKGTCLSCKLDMPQTIKSIKVEFHDDVSEDEI